MASRRAGSQWFYSVSTLNQLPYFFGNIDIHRPAVLRAFINGVLFVGDGTE
jgi:hypothetical protein